MMIQPNDRTLQERFQFIPSLIVFLLSLFMINALLHIVLKDFLNCGRDFCLGHSKSSWSFVLLDSFFLAMLITCTAFVKFKYKTFQRFGLAFIRPGVRQFVYGLMGGVALVSVFFYLTISLGFAEFDWRVSDIYRSLTNDYFIDMYSFSAYILILHVTALAVSVEIGFRGFLLPLLMSGFNKTIAVFASSFLFGLWQPIPSLTYNWEMPSVFYGYSAFAFAAFGVFSSVLALKTRMIWMSIGLHIGFMLIFYYSDLFGIYYRYFIPKAAMILLGVMFLILAAIVYYGAGWLGKVAKFIHRND